MEQKIDFIVTWVDGNDKEWQKEKEKYLDSKEKNIDNRNIRYRDMDCLRYWFRGVEKYASFVHKIYFVTCGQIPSWLNIHHPKLVIVHHKDYMPLDCLPTFNSNAIEASFQKIEGLSEKFVYFNDDMFIINKVRENDFFINDLPVDSMSFEPLIIKGNDDFHKKICNDLEIINRHFDYSLFKKRYMSKILSLKQGKYFFRTIPFIHYKTFIGFRNYHLPVPYLKSTFDMVWDKERDILNKTMHFRFRNNKESVNHWLFQYFQFASGKFVQRSSKFGKYIQLSWGNFDRYLLNNKYKVICINDSDKKMDFEARKRELISTFLKKFPDKSSFEL